MAAKLIEAIFVSDITHLNAIECCTSSGSQSFPYSSVAERPSRSVGFITDFGAAFGAALR